MHNAAFAALGLDDWHYGLLPVPPELFDETVRALPGSGYRGANVTIPHKVAALALADTATAAARGSGAANTLTFGDDGAIDADNTDAGGLLDALGATRDGAQRARPRRGRGRRAVSPGRCARRARPRSRSGTARPDGAAELAARLESDRASRPCARRPTTCSSTRPRSGCDEGDSRADLPLKGDPPATVVDLVYRGAATPTPVMAWAEEGRSPHRRRPGDPREAGCAELRAVDGRRSRPWT